MFLNCARSGTDGSRWLLLFFDDAVLLCVCMCWNTLCIGTAALKRCVHFLNSWNLKEASYDSFVFTSSILRIWRRPRTTASFSHLQLLEFEGGLARKLRFHLFSSWNLKEASQESFVFTNHGCDLNVRISTKHCVFRVAEKSWLACATLSGVVALAWKCSWTVRAVELMVPGDFFSSLMMLCYCVFACVETLCALELLHWRGVFTSWTLGIWRRPRTTASFSHLQFLEFEGAFARKLRFHIFNSWNLKEASHESFGFTSSARGIWRRPCTKASFSRLQLLEFEGGLARQLRFHLFNSWNLKQALHESFVFTSSTLGIRRRPRTKASFSPLQLVEFEGGLRPCAKASFSRLQLLEFEGGLARKLRFSYLQLLEFWVQSSTWKCFAQSL